MRQAFTLLGVMSALVLLGVYLTFTTGGETRRENRLEDTNLSPMSLTLTSPVFSNNESIPARYTCDGENKSPELHIANAPEGTQSFVLVMDDPDIPESVKKARGIEKFNHWSLYNIPPDTTLIPAGENRGVLGLSSVDGMGYVGPCPPDREHRYVFRLYALSRMLEFSSIPTLDEIETEAKKYALQESILIGRYARQ